MPYHDAFEDALEFEVWVARGAKRGGLVLCELVGTYGQLATSLQLDTAVDHALGVASLTEALGRLPEGFVRARSIVAVASLAGFGHEPIDPNAAFAAAWLDPHTLLVACPEGLGTLLALSITLCTLMHERAKYQRLGAAVPSTAPVPHEAPPAVMCALAGGISLDDWEALDAAAQGMLWTYLTETHVPELVVHPSLHPNHQARLAESMAQHVLTTLAESGLGHRPVHLWLGSDTITDVLSPYARDLAPQLHQWAKEHTPTGQAPMGAYDAMAAFLASDDRLAAEQHAAEQSCGLRRLVYQHAHFDIIDLARLDSSAWDAAITRPAPQGAQPVLLRLDAPSGAAGARFVERIIEPLGAQLASVALVTDASWHAVPTEAIAAIHTHLPWHTGAACSRAAPAYDAELSEMLAGVDAFMDVPMPARCCPQAIIDRLLADGHGVSFGLMPLIYALTRRPTGPKAPDAPAPQLQCFATRLGAAWRGPKAQLACAYLNALLAPQAPKPPPRSTAQPASNRPAPRRLRV